MAQVLSLVGLRAELLSMWMNSTYYVDLFVIQFFLPVGIWIVFIHWLPHTYFELWQHFQSVFSVLSCWRNRTSAPSSSLFTIARVAGCMQWTPTALLGLQVCLLKFPLPALLLVYDHDYSCFQVIQIHTSWWFFFCSQLRYFSMNSTIVFTQAKWIKEHFQISVPCWSCTIIFSHKLVQDIIPTVNCH